jgi:NAD(P)-dependent dehydrogenase (short-subunit alcohol dehydrogenase family)
MEDGMATVVMTGGSSGFGAVAAERLAQSNDARLIVGARRATSAGESLPLELTRLESVRGFAAAVLDRLAKTRVDALVLNAGVVRSDAGGRTVDDFETTFAVNHLAHYLLLRLLLPALADDGVVVLTTAARTIPRRAPDWRRRDMPTPGCWRTPTASPAARDCAAGGSQGLRKGFRPPPRRIRC